MKERQRKPEYDFTLIIDEDKSVMQIPTSTMNIIFEKSRDAAEDLNKFLQLHAGLEGTHYIISVLCTLTYIKGAVKFYTGDKDEHKCKTKN